MLRVFEAFAGYGSQSIALRNLGIEHEVVAISEIDKYAIKAYETIHGPINNLGDISKIDPKDIPEHDLFTYSFPCQDLSVAGKQAGLGKGTRSGLLYECEKIIEHCRPKYLLLENVKNLVGKKFKADFDKWLEYLEGLGYTNYWQALNAKNYGVPQNRERVFAVSVLGEHEPFEWPIPIPLDKCIADILEDEVDEINRQPEIITNYIQQEVKVRKHEVDIVELKKALKEAKQESGLSCKYIAYELNERKTTVEHWFRNDNCFSIPDKDIWFKLKKLLGITTDKFDKSIMEFEIKPNEYDMSNRVYHANGISPTLTATGESGAKKIFYDYRIRKLTTKECFRLMGMRDDDIDKIQAAGISNTQQYKMAGNSICIPVLEAIFKNLFKGE